MQQHHKEKTYRKNSPWKVLSAPLPPIWSFSLEVTLCWEATWLVSNALFFLWYLFFKISIKSVTPELTYSVNPDIFINIGKRLTKTNTQKTPTTTFLLCHSGARQTRKQMSRKWEGKKVAQEVHKFSFLGFSWLKILRPHWKSQQSLTAMLKLEKPDCQRWPGQVGSWEPKLQERGH